MTTPRGYLRDRAGKLEALIVFGDRRVRKATGFVVGQEDQAQVFLDGILAELAKDESAGAPAARAGELTLREWAEQWIAERKARKVISVGDEESQLRWHVLPVLGSYPLRSLTKAQMLAWVRSLPSRKRLDRNGGELISARYVHHIADTVRRLLAEAVDVDLLVVTPCTWKSKRDLPPKRDLDPEKRSRGGFDGWEVHELVTSPALPQDRRLLWALDFLTGMRPGEVSARRWRDISLPEPAAPADVLGRIVAATAWNSRVHREKSTKTNVTKTVPIHPLLAELLRAWREGGWEAYVGRAPTPDDLLVPSETGKKRNSSQTNKRFQGDVAKVGLREGRVHYETRSSFRSLAFAGGARREDVDLITHPSPRQASDLYTRLDVVWPALCRAILAVHVAPRARDPRPAPPGLQDQPVPPCATPLEQEKSPGVTGALDESQVWALQGLNLHKSPPNHGETARETPQVAAECGGNALPESGDSRWLDGTLPSPLPAFLEASGRAAAAAAGSGDLETARRVLRAALTALDAVPALRVLAGGKA